MLKVSKDLINKCANNLMFNLSNSETDLIFSEFSTIVNQIEYLSKIENVDETQPMTFPYKDHQTFLREDKPSKTLKSQEAVSNSKSKLGTQIKLPKVVGESDD